MSNYSGPSVLLLREVLGMKSSSDEERNSESEFILFNIVMVKKCGIGKARNWPFICILQFLFEQGCKNK